MKNKLIVILTLALVLASFVGCGGSEVNQTQESSNQTENNELAKEANEDDTSGDIVQLQVWSWDSVQGPGVQAAVDAYNEENPNVEVVYENIPSSSGNKDYMLKLEAAIEAGEGPDVFWLNVASQDYAATGAIEALDDYMSGDQDFDLANYSQAVAEIHTYDGKQYGIPKDMDAWFFIYNKKIFDQAGVSYPQDGWTWEDMVALGEEIGPSLGDGQYALYYETGPTYGLNQLTVQAGGSFVREEDGVFKANMDSPEVKEAFNKLKEIQDKGLAPSLVDNPDFDSLTSLISGNLAMSTVPSWNISAIAEIDPSGETFAAIAYPSVNGSNTTDTNGLAYVMNSNSKNKEAAWDLMKFLTSDQGARIHAENGAGLPANSNPDVKEAWVSSNSSIENLSVVSEIADNSFLREATTHPSLRPGLNSMRENLYPQFFAGEISVDQLVQEAQKMVEESMSQ